MEKETEQQAIKILHTDNGGEYTSASFMAYYKADALLILPILIQLGIAVSYATVYIADLHMLHLT